MVKGSAVRKADHPIDPLFLDRWSPRAMSGEAVGQADLMTLLEAARWAPSSFNNQPWRILYAHRDTPNWPLFFDLLVDANKAWAANAGVLLLFVSKKTFDHNGKPSITHSFDCGAAWANFALQGCRLGLVVHGMQGFDYDKARINLKVPEGYQVEAMIAVGKAGDPATLPEKLREKETPNSRRPLSQTACEGVWSL
ncbi:MAG TPA: nitroreductase family protein [Gemmataceae bacterium]|jgi:nitroreductase|nr:nitroreductase family protein [Gemmataceae bacterium]